MSKIKQIKIPMRLAEENILQTDDFKYKLVREQDGLTKKSKEVMWLEWNETGKFKDRHSEPEVGRCLLMSPFNDTFTWMTTDITEIIEQEENCVKFKTKNSTYTLWHV